MPGKKKGKGKKESAGKKGKNSNVFTPSHANVLHTSGLSDAYKGKIYHLPILISRSGFTSWGVKLAQQTNLTLIGRAKGKKYISLSGHHRLKF